MEFNFETIEINRRGQGLGSDCIRVNSTFIKVGDKIREQFIDQMANFESRLYISLEIDVVNRAIRLVPKDDPKDGYAFSQDGKYFKGGIPSHLKRKGLPRGDYKQLPEMPNVFVWQDPELVYRAPTAAPTASNVGTIEIGDRVTWLIKLKNDKDISELQAEGRVISLSEGVAQIMVDSPEYKEKFPGKFHVNVKIKNLTIVKKQ